MSSPKATPPSKAKLNERGHYTTEGVVYRVCPALLAMDSRHGIGHHKWPASWRSPVLHDGVTPNPDHLVDHEGHTANTFIYGPGHRPETPDEWPTCDNCGQALVASDGDPI